MAEEDPIPSKARTEALIALARIELDADPAELWRGLSRVFRMLVWQRNPALAVYAVHAASGGSRLG